MRLGRQRKPTSLKGLGVKYGSSLRKRYTSVVLRLKAKRRCESCGSLKFRRVSLGIWACKSCGHKVAGGAYSPE